MKESGSEPCAGHQEAFQSHEFASGNWYDICASLEPLSPSPELVKIRQGRVSTPAKVGGLHQEVARAEMAVPAAE